MAKSGVAEDFEKILVAVFVLIGLWVLSPWLLMVALGAIYPWGISFWQAFFGLLVVGLVGGRWHGSRGATKGTV